MTAATAAEGFPPAAGWIVWQSDTGRWWATRSHPFEPEAELAGACRTVDADDHIRVMLSVWDQEIIAHDQRLTDMARRLATALEQIHPAWRIQPTFHPENVQGRAGGWTGGWTATRHAPLTHTQRAAGLLPEITRSDTPGLRMALAVQDEIAHRHGHGPAPPNPAWISSP
ncbi:hypothetical protein Sme01_54130 [Sphaerisporangium melleum]|uniref:Uncharacterized protein n=1 Tax=Sphaerisporangium melleum TaxID=321316 RepID=A0A917VKV6_9ACTN|nr:hypothetical protein [Sphaerisporangium melleum]GGK91791.1 hypothetical protein GCM10007964_37990 [Sphaerisporangium melleum]GII72937.1 hypothetical protein Sme01_54130 [Sphaerisporangium melleum]